MAIDYPSGKKFELRIRDTGMLDHYDIFVNGTLRRHVSDDRLHKIPIDRPDHVMAIAVHFEGQDGGKSAILDVTDPANPAVVEAQSGLKHSYIVKGV